MTRPFECVKDISDNKELWKIAIKIHHKWNVITNTKQHFEMIVMDKDGTDIHVIVPPLYSQTFDSQLAVNDTVTISNFQVQLNDVVFKPSNHKFLLKFSGGTTIGDRNKHLIPEKDLKITPFSDIITGKWKKDVLIDIIGMVDEVGYIQMQAGGKKCQVNIILKDLSNNTIHCTLWETYAQQFIKYNQNKSDPSCPTVILLQYAKVKEEGKYPLSVSNTYNVTKLLINDDLKAIQDFMKSIPKDALSVKPIQNGSQSQVWSQSSSNSQLSLYQKFVSKTVVLPIATIKQLKTETFCTTVARIDKLIASQHGWYKIQFEVVHCGYRCKFVLWDRESEQLLELSAAQMRSTMIEICLMYSGGVSDPLEYPLALDKLVGKQKAFKVKWQPLWDSCSVVSIAEDNDIFKQLSESCGLDDVQVTDLPPTPLLQIKESVDEANAIEESEVIAETEITSKLSSDLVTPTAKRSNPDGSSESTTLMNLTDGELSSNKLKKQIKIEK
ncbi:uncharacterized protein LOC131651367 [Vicia villosa]|uniref:uncharacterized protein LOC131651367 n=1 Tax=Vicia villosa TaxID=3911 RepID=UPI00273B9B6A|nr:uncharacterized protein LOC131651367 [Vicia villosa]